MTHFENVIEALKMLDAGGVVLLQKVVLDARSHMDRVFVCGNGGSAATAIHFAADLRLVGVDAWDLLSPAKLTQIGNDIDFGDVFVRQRQFGGLLICFSCSGVSPNITAALRQGDFLITSRHASPHALFRYREIGYHKIVVPSADYQVIEDVHLAICHAVMKALM